MEADPQRPVDFEHIIRYFDRAVPSSLLRGIPCDYPTNYHYDAIQEEAAQ